MICDICGRDNAIIHIHQIIGKDEISLNICEECAAANGFNELGHTEGTKMTFSGIVNKLKNIRSNIAGRDLNIVCSNCNTTLAEVKKSGIVGCEKCYDCFDEYISRYFTENFGKTAYPSAPAGRIRPKEIISQADYRKSLEKKLEKAVSDEDYETAALLRDKIKALNPSSRFSGE